ncbi:hypothetical protein CSE16_09935 [Solibacillus sp. R5-41]|nr:hypothetical protein CSE16_09935 [Solibacillus sp. R5-41]
MTFSNDCIYNSEHVHFEKIQNLLRLIKNKELSTDERNKLKIERTKLSLYMPNKYEQYFSLAITKDISAISLNFLIGKFKYMTLQEN